MRGGDESPVIQSFSLVNARFLSARGATTTSSGLQDVLLLHYHFLNPNPGLMYSSFAYWGYSADLFGLSFLAALTVIYV